MPGIEVVLALLLAVAMLATLASRVGVPYPILLVLGGLVLGFVPGLPRVELDPDLVFLIFLPPLLYVSALFTSWRDFRANLRPISLLAVGLVIFTTCIVAVVAHAAIEDLTWAAAFTLGAIVSPTDAIAATAIAQRLGVPRRVVTVLEGESLVNDATGIVAYRIAAAAVTAGTFSIWQAGLSFIAGSIGGIVIGLAAGWAVIRLRRSLSPDPSVQNTISLLTPFLAYLPAEELPTYVWEELALPGELHFSGVLAVVVAGLYLGRRGASIIPSSTRLQGYAVWELISFLLNGAVFILIGLQLRNIVDGLSEYSMIELSLYAGLISLTVVIVRILWVFPATYLPRVLSRCIREYDPPPPGRPSPSYPGPGCAASSPSPRPSPFRSPLIRARRSRDAISSSS